MNTQDTTTVQILLVEDNPWDARLLQEFLKDVRATDIVMTHTEYLEAALDLAEKNGYDVVLADLSLPDAFGLETVERIRSRIPDRPLVVLTGTDDEEVAIKALQSGAQDYLVKGQVDGNLLIRAIRYAIERKRVELEREAALAKAAAAERLSTVGTLAAGIAHELNQPLQTFKFTIDNLRRQLGKGQLDEKILLKKLNKMDQLSDYMSTVITNLLGYVRPDEEFNQCSLKEIVTAVLSMIGKQLEKQGIAVEVEFPEELSVYCNRNAMVQVFINLLVNARDAYLNRQPEEGGDVDRRVRITAKAKDGVCRISVQDWAGGIPERIRHQIFDPFVSTKPAVKGTGMGLHVVRQIMAGHGGEIDLTVDPDVGTTFELILPQKVDEHRPRSEQLIEG
jgi:signal transduction histidine kinase